MESGEVKDIYIIEPRDVDAEVRKQWGAMYQGNIEGDMEKHAHVFEKNDGECFYR